MGKNEWIKEIELDDLDEKNREIAQVIGLSNFLNLSKYYGGGSIYINKLDNVLNDVRNKKIKEDYKTLTFEEMKEKYNLTIERLRQIVKGENDERQLNLFQINNL